MAYPTSNSPSMRDRIHIVFAGFMLMLYAQAHCQQGPEFSGQLSAWMHYNPSNELPLWTGARYLPRLNLGLPMKDNRLIDFEASANLYGSAGFQLFDTARAHGRIKPYRMWGRFSGRQFEVRVGLQKLNFGSATLFRPLMWFDQLDPRDPLQLTDGVWAALMRYYFMNNATLWLWTLYGNEKVRGWEAVETDNRYPEAGGRFQVPVPRGEMALSYHFRYADSRSLSEFMPSYGKIPEHRIGFDAKFDVVVGWWLEAVWVNKGENLGPFTNQEIINTGLDYTIGVGNGLGLLFEQVWMSWDESPWTFASSLSFSGLSLTYPLGLFDNLSAIVYYDWKSEALYSFVNWNRTYDRITLYLMAYWNPDQYRVPVQESSEILYAGKGIQFLINFNH